MKARILYIKIDQNIEVYNTRVYMEDIAKLYSPDAKLVHDLNHQLVKVIKTNKDVKYCFSIMKVIEMIGKLYPDVEVVNMGETEFILSYNIPKKPSKIWEVLKTIFVGLVVFFGGALSIMTFNADASIQDIFDKMYELVTGTAKSGWSVVEVGYSIGIAAGIIIFFNHFSKFKITTDPTPIQIEMRKYENDVNSALIQNASREGKIIDSN
ncbi:MAG: stage V sporulation protein AA [bacterium]|nr:stage V sporulation protein AA [bacterium]